MKSLFYIVTVLFIRHCKRREDNGHMFLPTVGVSNIGTKEIFLIGVLDTGRLE